jgi:Alkylmercury lyase
MQHDRPTIRKENLIQAWQHRHRHLSEAQEQLCRVAFGLLRVGRAATSGLLADRTGLAAEVVEHELTTLEMQGLIVWDARGVVGICGLSLVATPHALCLDGQPLFTWCALDAVGIPAGLGANATVRSQCFSCQQDMTIVFQTGRVQAVSAAALRIWVTLPGQGQSAVGDT